MTISATLLKVAHAARPGIWNQRHHLDRMTLRQLVVAYFQYYAIQAYLLLAVVSAVVAFYNPPSLLAGSVAALFVVTAYPLIWYALHRWVLHGKWMWKSPLTARTWKRIHYDHHQDPNHLEILFGALYTTLPTIVVATVPVGWLIGGLGGAAVALCAGLLTTCVYEFVHCIQHLSYKPKNRVLAAMKARHMAHHFHDESGNFGITSFWPDRLFGTFYEREQRKLKSATVFNLGYTDEVARHYPWVAAMSDGVAKGHPRRRAAANEAANDSMPADSAA
ncbi:sterol desaturase family protein [Sandaracinobacteroides saxicola]|uniref:Sterol desaturase family protein n=1 Tax=Sandaracinobacteroides saxicola TaxID=2759707 RepID=A0A7G5IKJ8_9SPHN|nr:sterol desaturase family protein [Sandaracinobacteroides saxicola]QMW23890.1 sterol desaturase family protein [Sandaracinobacteroides saxicola]